MKQNTKPRAAQAKVTPKNAIVVLPMPSFRDAPKWGAGFKWKSKGSKDALVTQFVVTQRLIGNTATYIIMPLPAFDWLNYQDAVYTKARNSSIPRAKSSYRASRRNADRKAKEGTKR